MPVRVEYLGDERGVLYKGEGFVTGNEIISAIEEAYSSEDKIREYIYQLNDYRNIDGFEASPDDIRRIAEMDAKAFEINPTMIIAAVTATRAAYGFGRMWQLLVDESNPNVRVFQSLEEAKSWIRERRRLGKE